MLVAPGIPGLSIWLLDGVLSLEVGHLCFELSKALASFLCIIAAAMMIVLSFCIVGRLCRAIAGIHAAFAEVLWVLWALPYFLQR